MNKVCAQCGISYTVEPDDLEFYDKISPVFNGQKYRIPEPEFCPGCRMQRFMSWRCERFFHSRNCDCCNKKIISFHRKNAPWPVYCLNCWWGDSWDGVNYGLEFDFEKTFFEQFSSLQNNVPTVNLVVSQGENSDYSNYGSRLRNCYLVIAGDRIEDCLYGSYVWLSKDCVDCMNVIGCEQCYECTESENCHSCHWCQKCESCNNCILGYDLRSCSDCIGCVGLRNKQYCFFNDQLSKDEYLKISNRPVTTALIEKWKQELKPLRLAHPHKFAQIIHCENSSGDSISQAKNSHFCFDSFDLEDCKYIINGPGELKDCYDFAGITGSELSYQGASIHGGHLLLFSERCWQGNNNIFYCSLCMGCNHCFGCIGLKKQSYCILNKQYTKEEYEKLVPKIIEKMKADKEWGEFFPVELSPFAYNETVAQEYFPLTKEEVIARGWKWRDQTDEMPKVAKVIPASKLPDGIEDVPDDIVNWAVECEATKRPFKIIKQELDFYRQMKLPIPHFHPDERHRQRMALRNPRKLWKRNCDKCGKEIETTYSPERPEIVYCEECYLKEVY